MVYNQAVVFSGIRSRVRASAPLGPGRRRLLRCEEIMSIHTFSFFPLPAGIVLLAAALFPHDASARTWTDDTGLYHLDAELIGYGDHAVILQRQDGELGAFPLERLSQEDQDFLQSKRAQEIHSENLAKPQTWTMQRGLKVPGRVIDYARREVTIQRRRGAIYVNHTRFENLPNVYQAMLPKIVQYYESVEDLDIAGFKRWVMALKGEPKTYTLEGVLLELENGDEYGVPFFFFSEADRDLLRQGWEEWLAANEQEADYQEQSERALRLQAMSAAYRRNQQYDRQVATLSLNLQAIQAGLLTAWEVTLYPGPGVSAPPRWIVIPARTSDQASQLALRQNPGFRLGPVRRVSR
jgi:hypothetical protein